MLLRKTVSIKALTTSKGKFTLRLYEDHIKGVIDGLRNSRRSPSKYSSTSEAYKQAKRLTQNYCGETLDKIKSRQRYISDIVGIFSAHSDSLESASDKVDNIFDGRNADGTISPENELAMSVLKAEGV